MRTGAEKTTLDKKLTLDEAIVKGRDTVADALTYLTSSQVRNFYARVINLMDRYAIPGMGTMGVSVQRGRYIFVYDPIFAATVSYEEVCATCEHEVLHLILEQIPRSLTLRKIFASDEDTSLFDITSNLAVDLAANELLARSWPKIKHPEKPLGEWVIPEKYEPPLPKDMAYEDYHKLLMELLSKRLKTSPTNLYKLAKQLLKKQIDKVNETLNPPNDKKEDEGQEPQEDPQEGQGEGQGEGNGPGEGQGQGSGDGQGQGEGSGQAQGPGQGSGASEPEMSPEQLQQEIGNLDPIDQKVLEMLVNSMKSHIGWNAANPDESDTHKAQEHGKEIIKSAYTSLDKSRGTLPGHMVELIRKMLTPPSVSWITLFHNIIQRTKQTKRMRGMARPSKKLSAMKVFAKRRVEEDHDPRFIRYARIQQMPVFPGIKQDRKFTVYYVVDTSGSMGTDELRAGLAELLNIQKADSDMTICVIYADTHVCKEYWIDSTGQIDEELTGRGGTDFEAVFVHIQELLRNSDKAADVLVYCTDGYAPAPTTRLPIPVVWLLTPRGAPVMSDSGHITILMKDYQLEESSV
jgi:predicted metal-dependent peptidase